MLIKKTFLGFFAFLVLISSYGKAPLTSLKPKYQTGRVFVKIRTESDRNFPAPAAISDQQGISASNGNYFNLITTYKITKVSRPFSKLTNKDLQKVYVFVFEDTLRTEALLKQLAALPYVEYAEKIPLYESAYVPNDLDSRQWNLTKVHADNAWNISKGSSSITVAVVDDAVRLTHTDLNANLWLNSGELAGNNIDDDGNGYIDDIHGYDVADNDNNPNPPPSVTNEYFTHGTHCAGIVSAVSNNATGIASLGFTTKIMAVKTKPDNSPGGTLPFAYEGVLYAIAAHADVISMSWGGTGYSQTYQLLFNEAYAQGIVCVAAAGNNNSNVSFYPAAYTHIISVAASDINDGKASFSNYGSTIDVTAPGVNIWSTLAGTDNSYGYLSGTSMACPLVSSLCGLMLSVDSNLNPEQLESCLKSSCDKIDDLNPAYTGLLGAGRINAHAALICLQKTPLADFSVSSLEACVNQQVYYHNESIGSISGTIYQWVFPGGSPSTSSIQNPVVTYNTAGTYSATLTVTNSFGTNSITKTGYIHVSVPAAVLSGNASVPAGGSATLKADLTGTGPFSITYTDGTLSHTINNITSTPYYFQVTPGQNSTTYTLQNFSSNSGCQGTVTGSATITKYTPPASSDCSIAGAMFERAYGGSAADDGNCVIQLTDGNYIVSTTTSGYGTTGQDILLHKMDPDGNILWSKKYGGNNNDVLWQVLSTSDNGLIMTTTSRSYSVNGNIDIFLIKTDASGTVEWSKTYGGASDDESRSLIHTADGGYLISGFTYSYPQGTFADMYFIKTDAAGTVQWTKAIECENHDFGYVAKQLSDGSYIIAGNSQVASDNLYYDYLLLKMDGTGNVLWNKKFGLHDNDGVRDIIVTSDGGFITGGHIRLNGYGQSDAALTKFDANGNFQWIKAFGGSEIDDITDLSTTSDGNYIAAGVTDSYGNGRDVFTVKFDLAGNFLWSKTYGKSNMEQLTGFNILINTADGGFGIVGSSNSTGLGGNDLYFIKTDCNGNTGCTSKDIVLSIYPVVLPVVTKTLVYSTGITSTSGTIAAAAPPAIQTAYLCPVETCAVNADFSANDSTICVNQSISFKNTSSSGHTNSYKWFINGTLVSTAKDIDYLFKQAGSFKIMLNAHDTVLGCEETDSLIINVNALPLLVISNDTSICSSSSVHLKVSGADSYVWSPQAGLSCTMCANPIATPAGKTTYYVTGKNTNGCVSDDSVKIGFTCCYNGSPSPDASYTFTQQSICLYDSLEIMNHSYHSPTASYQWEFSGGIPATSTNAIPPRIRYLRAGVYRVRLIIDDGCGKDTLDKSVNVLNPPISFISKQAICLVNDRFQMNQQIISDYSYKWSPSAGISNPENANPLITYSGHTVYYVRIKDESTGCITTDSVRVIPSGSVIANAGKDTTIELGSSVQLKGCCGQSYQWSPTRDLDNAVIFNPVVSPEETVRYYLTVVDANGCNAVDSVLITVLKNIFIPNLITPNNDYSNDFFELKGFCKNTQIEIYNRWGDLIYKNDNYRNTWDGSNVSDGVFYYSITDGCSDKKYKGWCQIMR